MDPVVAVHLRRGRGSAPRGRYEEKVYEQLLAECEDCDWTYHARDEIPGKMNSRARRHAHMKGHAVIVRTRMRTRIEPS